VVGGRQSAVVTGDVRMIDVMLREALMVEDLDSHMLA
jgi:hypothetical protein